MERLNVAIVGCGIISGNHIEGFRRNADRARIAACCDTDGEKARKAVEASGENGARAVTDYAAILADQEIEAVDLCLPHHLHAEMAISAARAGKHILCEKPLALTLEDCDRMAEAAREAGVVLMHGENLRTAESVEKAAELIRAGRVGALVGLQAAYAHWQSELLSTRPKSSSGSCLQHALEVPEVKSGRALNKGWRTRPGESGGGHLIDGGIHYIDVLRHLGGEIMAVQARMTRFRPELGAESEDTAVLNLRYAGGHLGQLFATHASRGRGASSMLTAFGTEGCLSLDAFGGTHSVTLFSPGQPPEQFVERKHWQESFAREITHFLDVVQKGEPLRATPEDGRENLRVVLAAYESARTGREVAL